MIKVLLLASVALLGACGGSEAPAGTTDSGVGDSAVAADTTVADSGTPDTTSTDTTTADTATDGGGGDSRPDVVDDTPLAPCAPFWCGCGTCVDTDVVCSRSKLGCPLGCASGPCPALTSTTTCSESGDRCVRNGLAPTDVGCYSHGDCPPGYCCSGTGAPPAKQKCVAAPGGGKCP